MNVRLIAITVSSALLACAGTTPTALMPEGARVRVSEGTAVDGCEYLGDFIAGGASQSNRATASYLESNQVRNLAAAKGATDVVFDSKARGHVVGKGYKCP
jgi:hypothetical protein